MRAPSTSRALGLSVAGTARSAPPAHSGRALPDALDELRKQERGGLSFVGEAELDRLGVEGGLTPEEMVVEGERFAHMTGAFLALPKKERLALVMFKLKGLSHEEIGRRLGVPRHGVPRYLARALAKCAEAMAAFERAEADEMGDGKRERTPNGT